MIKIENPTYMWTTLLTQIEIEFHLNNAALGVENPFAPLTFPVPARPTSSPGPLGLSSHPKRLQYNSAWHCQALDRSNRAIDQLASVSWRPASRNLPSDIQYLASYQDSYWSLINYFYLGRHFIVMYVILVRSELYNRFLAYFISQSYIQHTRAWWCASKLRQ